MAIGLATLQYVLEEGSRNDWFDSRAITVCAFVAAFVLAAFVIRELTAQFPAVDLRLFKDSTFLSGTLIGAMMFAILMSITFLLPVFMQELLGFTATQSGEALMPRALAMMVGIPIVGRLYNKVQPRILVLIGISLVALSTYMMSHYTLDTGARTVVFAIIVQGFGFASLFVPLTAVALQHDPALSARRRDRASTRCCGRSAARWAWPPSRRCCRTSSPPRATGWQRTCRQAGPK